MCGIRGKFPEDGVFPFQTLDAFSEALYKMRHFFPLIQPFLTHFVNDGLLVAIQPFGFLSEGLEVATLESPIFDQ